MQGEHFWSRVGHWFKTPRDDGDSAAGAATHTVARDSASDSAEVGLADAERSDQRLGLVTRLRSTKRTSRIERMQADQTRVVHLVESVQRHLEAQGERSESIARSLEMLAGSMSHLPEASKAQLALLQRVGEETAAQAGAVRRLEEVLAQLPPLADAQRESIVSLGRHMESSRDVNASLAATIGGVTDTLTACGQSATASVRAIENIGRTSTQREERVAALLEAQNDRLSRIMWIAVAAGGAAIVTGIIGLIRIW